MMWCTVLAIIISFAEMTGCQGVMGADWVRHNNNESLIYLAMFWILEIQKTGFVFFIFHVFNVTASSIQQSKKISAQHLKLT